MRTRQNGSDNQSTSLVESLQAELKDPSPANDALNPDVTTANSFSDAQANNPNTIVAVSRCSGAVGCRQFAVGKRLRQSRRKPCWRRANNPARLLVHLAARASMPLVACAIRYRAMARALVDQLAVLRLHQPAHRELVQVARPARTHPNRLINRARLLNKSECDWFNDVARSFSRLGPDGGQVTLKLNPPQLGVLNVSIKIEGQTHDGSTANRNERGSRCDHR